jgi:hypothetical protein
MQDATAIIDGIQRSVETAGWSGRDGITLDSISFRIDARRLDIPHDTEIVEALMTANDLAKNLLEGGALGYSNEGVFLVYSCEALPNCISLQVILNENRQQLDVIATLHRSDVVNDLPRDILVCELLMDQFALVANRHKGFLTVNIGLATVMWDDVQNLFEEEEIEIPM